jgi:AcrR family transcriptional regulator
MYAAKPNRRSAGSRRRVLGAVRELLEEGVFHETRVEEVAERAGVSRATLYQHFGSRLGLIDAICESFADRGELRAVMAAETLDELVARVVDFWAAEEKILVQLYGAVAVDPAARAFAERQRRDRYRELRRVLGGAQARAFPTLAMLTSFDTYLELRRHAGLPKRDLVSTLQTAANALTRE